MNRFFISVVALGALLVTVVFAGARYQYISSVPSYTTWIILFLAGTTAVLFYFLMQRTGSTSFTPLYLMSIVLKMLTYCIFILVIIFSDKSGAFANALLFMISYALFTGLEVAFLFKRINRR